jgi:hypothetical protein
MCLRWTAAGHRFDAIRIRTSRSSTGTSNYEPVGTAADTTRRYVARGRRMCPRARSVLAPDRRPRSRSDELAGVTFRTGEPRGRGRCGSCGPAGRSALRASEQIVRCLACGGCRRLRGGRPADRGKWALIHSATSSFGISGGSCGTDVALSRPSPDAGMVYCRNVASIRRLLLGLACRAHRGREPIGPKGRSA